MLPSPSRVRAPGTLKPSEPVALAPAPMVLRMLPSGSRRRTTWLSASGTARVPAGGGAGQGPPQAEPLVGGAVEGGGDATHLVEHEDTVVLGVEDEDGSVGGDGQAGGQDPLPVGGLGQPVNERRRIDKVRHAPDLGGRLLAVALRGEHDDPGPGAGR